MTATATAAETAAETAAAAEATEHLIAIPYGTIGVRVTGPNEGIAWGVGRLRINRVEHTLSAYEFAYDPERRAVYSRNSYGFRRATGYPDTPTSNAYRKFREAITEAAAKIFADPDAAGIGRRAKLAGLAKIATVKAEGKRAEAARLLREAEAQEAERDRLLAAVAADAAEAEADRQARIAAARERGAADAAAEIAGLKDGYLALADARTPLLVRENALAKEGEGARVTREDEYAYIEAYRAALRAEEERQRAAGVFYPGR